MTSTRAAAQRLSWTELSSLSQQFGDSFYILDDHQFERNFRRLQGAFRAQYENTWVGYSYKTNYTPHLCRIVDNLGGYAEVVSEMEYELAERIGVEKTRIILNGPMKSEHCLSRALLGGSVVNLDSIRDLRLLIEIAGRHDEHLFEVAIRCNFPIRSSFFSRFGFDVEGEAFEGALSTIRSLRNVELVGLHCHFPDRDLDSYRKRVKRMLDLSMNIFGGRPPRHLNFGGGYFSNMPDELKQSFGVKHVDFDEYADVLAGSVAKAYGGRSDQPKLFIEPGTALVADALHFFARVVDIKQVGGKRFATVDGSIFNISAAARKTNLPVEVIRAENACGDSAGPVSDIVGYTCIEADCMTRDFLGPIDVDDFVHYSNVGSYSIVMKPPFILPNVAIIRLDRDTGEPILVKSRETIDDIFSEFVF
jgi:diaminopimelate decarboxylase